MPQTDDVEKALAKGDLKFTLDGYKLKGSWVLVRTRGYASGGQEGRSWLLIKHRDEWAGDLDITTFAPLSVKSNQDFPGILAADNPDVWKTNRPAAGGETGAMLRDIIEKAAALKLGRAPAGTTTARKRAPAAAPKRAARRHAGRASKSTRRSGESR
jgi:bifunctional non-homologous end joining protein LigD